MSIILSTLILKTDDQAQNTWKNNEEEVKYGIEKKKKENV